MLIDIVTLVGLVVVAYLNWRTYTDYEELDERLYNLELVATKLLMELSEKKLIDLEVLGEDGTPE